LGEVGHNSAAVSTADDNTASDGVYRNYTLPHGATFAGDITDGGFFQNHE
jgi:hypothetical protein